MKITEKIFESFKWIDIENPIKEDLEKITKEHGLNYYLIKDSLEKGHLPKYEKTYKIDFFIFRAYTSDIKLHIDEVGEMDDRTPVALARSYADAPDIDGVVQIDSPGDCKPGDFMEVRIIDADSHDLWAEPIKPA
jgi:Mg2+ and Co2+ transporter CorA